MSIRTKVLGMVDVMMRVPPILVIDEILKIGMGLPSRTYSANSVDSGGGIDVPLNNNTDTSIAYNILTNVTNFTNASLEQAIDNATTGGFLSSSFGVLIDDFAKDMYITEILSMTAAKIALCVFSK